MPTTILVALGLASALLFACENEEEETFVCDAAAIQCCVGDVRVAAECTAEGLKCPDGSEGGMCPPTSRPPSMDAEDAGRFSCDAIYVPCCRDGVERAAECTAEGRKCPAGFSSELCYPTAPSGDMEDGDVDVVCSEPRKLGDGKQPGDRCWAPPENYCSDVASTTLIAGACGPNDGPCCVFGASCAPCGWTECPYPCDATLSDWTPSDDDQFCGFDPDVGFPEGCPQTGLAWAERAIGCDMHRPDPVAAICYDEILY